MKIFPPPLSLFSLSSSLSIIKGVDGSRQIKRWRWRDSNTWTQSVTLLNIPPTLSLTSYIFNSVSFVFSFLYDDSSDLSLLLYSYFVLHLCCAPHFRFVFHFIFNFCPSPWYFYSTSLFSNYSNLLNFCIYFSIYPIATHDYQVPVSKIVRKNWSFFVFSHHFLII